MGWHHGKEELVCWEEFMIRVVSGWRTVILVNDNILNDPLQMMHKQTRDGPRFMSLGSGHGIGSIWSRSTVQAPLLSDQVGRWRTPKWQDPRQKLATTVFGIHTAFVRKINRSNITETNAVVRFILWIIIVVFWWQGANRKTFRMRVSSLPLASQVSFFRPVASVGFLEHFRIGWNQLCNGGPRVAMNSLRAN